MAGITPPAEHKGRAHWETTRGPFYLGLSPPPGQHTHPA